MNCLVLLCGCGHIDGAEVRESVLVLLELDKLGVTSVCCSVNLPQKDVVNHIDGIAAKNESRNLLVESARISRGDILNIKDVNVSEFDMLILPGGLGVAKNFSNLLNSEGRVTVLEEVKHLILEFYKQKKAIGGVCISPAIIASSLSEIGKMKVTLGEDTGGFIAKCKGEHLPCPVDGYIVDQEHKIFSCPAYMFSERLHKIHLGIQKMVSAMVKCTENSINN